MSQSDFCCCSGDAMINGKRKALVIVDFAHSGLMETWGECRCVSGKKQDERVREREREGTPNVAPRVLKESLCRFFFYHTKCTVKFSIFLFLGEDILGRSMRKISRRHRTYTPSVLGYYIGLVLVASS